MNMFLCIYLMCFVGGYYVWPSLAEVNTRARRYVACWLKHQKKEEIKQAHIMRVMQCADIMLVVYVRRVR